MNIQHFIKAQKNLGCPGCRFCDPAALFKSACCTYPGLIDTNDNMKCLTRREAETPGFKELKPIETDEYSLCVYQCKCGFHIGLDATYLEQVGDIITICPSCKNSIQIIEF